MIRILLSTLISLVFLANSQIAFASAFEKKLQQSSEESLPQEAANGEDSEGKCECENSDFVNYEENNLINFTLFVSLVRIENEKIFSDFSRSPSSPPPDSLMS